jgi:trehalose 6-phosphate synthase
MIGSGDIKDVLRSSDFKLIIAADGEAVTSIVKDGKVVSSSPAGGVSVALDPIARITDALYIARAKNADERKALDSEDKMLVGDAGGSYTLKRLFFDEKDFNDYYYGFANQTLWPLCHVAFEEPRFSDEWYKGYKKINQQFAEAIREEIEGKTLIWIQDYQLSLVPALLGKPKDTITAMFWHIPWPTWEVFRILPYKKEILTSLLTCDFLAFHRAYQARNFLATVERELETRIGIETQKVHFNNNVTQVKSYPLGIDIDVIRSMVHKEEEETVLSKTIRDLLGIEGVKPHRLDWYFSEYKVIFGVDRLDYTKGIAHRLEALDRFFEKNPQYIGKAVYLGIMAPSREVISSYEAVRREAKALEHQINLKHKKDGWKPIHLIHDLFSREDVLNFYRQADVCLVTPLDDGMNLVSKEFIVASSLSADPGMLVLSQFAGSATDLSQALIVNPYDIEEVSKAIKAGLEMERSEKLARIKQMMINLEEKNVYEWAYNNLRDALNTTR